MPWCRFMCSQLTPLSLLVLLAGLTTPPLAQADAVSDATWSSIIPGAPTPPYRSEHSAAYDPIAQRMLMFGGNGWSDIWGFDLSGANTWTPLSAAGPVPPPARGAMAIFDASRNRMVIYNGDNTGTPGNVGAYSGSAWTALPSLTTGGLVPCVVYDSTNDRLIVYGGLDAVGPRNDVWALSFATLTWTQIIPQGPVPTGRWGHVGVYDPDGDRLIVFSGRDVPNDTWALTLSGTPTWSQLFPFGTAPVSRAHAGVAYDPDRKRMLVHGGYVNASGERLNDTWALGLSGTPAWEQLPTVGAPPPVNSHQTAVYDEESFRLVVHGGLLASPNQGQVWTLDFGTPGPSFSLNVNTVGSGSVTRSPNRLNYEPGTPVELTAVGAPGWRFTGWSGDLTDSANPITVTMNADMNLTATFERGRYGLQVTVNGAGTVSRSPDQADYLYGDVVTLTAIPQNHWTFVSWSGDAFGPNPLTAIAITGETSVTATFVDFGFPTAQMLYPNGGEILVVGSDYKLAWVASDEGGPVSIDVELSRDDGATYETIAEDLPGTESYIWLVTGPGSNTTTAPHFAGRFRITVTDGAGHQSQDQSDAAFAIYDLVPHHTVTVAHLGNGTITRTPDQALYDEGSTVVLTAVPDSGWEFVEWSGDTTGTTNPLEIVVYRNFSITGRFRDVVAPAVSVVYPNGGQVLVAGSSYKLAWDAFDQVGVVAVNLSVSRDSGTTWEPIADELPNTGTFVWTASRPGQNIDTTPHFASYLRITARDSAGNSTTVQSSSPFAIHDLRPLAVGVAPGRFALESISPNPTAGSSTITYSLPIDGVIRLSIFDLQGREVAVLANGPHGAGTYRAVWGRGSDAPSRGLYFVRYRTKHGTMSRRIVTR